MTFAPAAGDRLDTVQCELASRRHEEPCADTPCSDRYVHAHTHRKPGAGLYELISCLLSWRPAYHFRYV